MKAQLVIFTQTNPRLEYCYTRPIIFASSPSLQQSRNLFLPVFNEHRENKTYSRKDEEEIDDNNYNDGGGQVMMMMMMMMIQECPLCSV